MGWVMMSERELNRVEVLAQVDDNRLSVDNAANMLDLTRRQIFRLLKRYRQDGATAIRHQSRGKTPNNKIHGAKRDYALALVKEQYPDFGPTLAAEMLAQHHGFKVSRETLRKWMAKDGIWLSRSPNGKRWGRRDADGVIVEAYGFDLSPMSARVEEFGHLHGELQAERELCQRLKRQITVARRMIRARIEAALSGALKGPWGQFTTMFEDLLSWLPHRQETSETLECLLAKSRREPLFWSSTSIVLAK